MRTAAALLIMLVLAGCSSVERGCTMIGDRPGVSVQVPPTTATGLTALVLEICVRDECTEHAVALDPGSVTVDQGCDGPDPDDTCSATAVPDGSLTGFVDVELPTGTIMVGARLTRAGTTTTLDRREFTVGTIYPNGRDCPGESNQVRVIVESSGLR